jgi:hypothetical protein
MKQNNLFYNHAVNKHLAVFLIILFGGLFVLRPALAVHPVCETNTTKNGSYCNWDYGNSWCGGNTLTCQTEPANADETPASVTGGTWNFCNACSWVLTCNSGYTKCPSDNTCITTQTCPPGQTFNACTVACEGTIASLKLAYDSAGGSYLVNSSAPILTIPSSGGVGIGTTTPTARLSVVPASGYAILAGDFRIGNVALPVFETDAATKGYVDAVTFGTSTTSGFLPLAGGTMAGAINMGSQNITNVNTLSVSKLTATTIDPLYNIKGINYSTFAPSFAGGVKEEYTGKIKVIKLNYAREYEAIIDFSEVEEGSDLWVWRQVINFNKDAVEVVATPYGKFAQVYYLIDGNKLIFRADKAVEISYRLTAKRFDWREWPTRAVDQTISGLKVVY